MKIGGQRIDQKRKKGWWNRRRERIKAFRRYTYREKRKRQNELRRQFEEEEEEHHHFPRLVVQLPQGTTVLIQRHELQTSFNSELLVYSGAAL